jgi:hypothetical protein
MITSRGSEYANYCALVDAFAAKMKERFLARIHEGKRGWDDPNQVSDEALKFSMASCAELGELVDMANYAVMIWNREEVWGLKSQAAVAAQVRKSGPHDMSAAVEEMNR